MRAIKSKLPKWIFIQLQEGCNLRCKMCYEWGNNGSYHKKKNLSVLDFKVIEKLIQDCREIRPHYELFGGEPLLYPNIKEVLSVISENGSTVDIPTNGTTLVRDAKMLVRLGVQKLYISLDGPEAINDYQRGKGVYKKVLAGIDKVYEVREREGKAYPKVGIGTTITPNNHQKIKELFFTCLDLDKIDHISLEMQTYTTGECLEAYGSILKKEFNINSIEYASGYKSDISAFEKIDTQEVYNQIQLLQEECERKEVLLNLYPKKITKENLDNYFHANWDKVKGCRKRCVFPWISTEITAQGDVASCHSMYDLTYGNVYEDSLVEVWNNEKYNHFRKLMKKQLLPICPACCLYYNEKLTGK